MAENCKKKGTKSNQGEKRKKKGPDDPLSQKQKGIMRVHLTARREGGAKGRAGGL